MLLNSIGGLLSKDLNTNHFDFIEEQPGNVWNMSSTLMRVPLHGGSWLQSGLGARPMLMLSPLESGDSMRFPRFAKISKECPQKEPRILQNQPSKHE